MSYTLQEKLQEIISYLDSTINIYAYNYTSINYCDKFYDADLRFSHIKEELTKIDKAIMKGYEVTHNIEKLLDKDLNIEDLPPIENLTQEELDLLEY